MALFASSSLCLENSGIFLKGVFFCSYFSPLLKSLATHPDVGLMMEGNDVEGREDFIGLLESRFLFLAADARSTLRSVEISGL